MERTIPKKAVLILSIIFTIPFFVISLYTYLLIKNGEKNDLINTMKRFNDNTATAVIDTPVEEINTQIRALSSFITYDVLSQYVDGETSYLSLIIPSMVNSSSFFRDAIIFNSHDKYKIYPFIKMNEYKPSLRPWYYPSGIKDEIHFSQPYVNKYPPYGKDITVSMNLFNNSSEPIGAIAFDLDLPAMSRVLKNITIPYYGRFKIVAQDGSVILYKNANEIFKRNVPMSWIKKATENSGYFYDKPNGQFVFYKTYSNPNWIAFSVVDESSFININSDIYRVFYFTVFGGFIFYLMISMLLVLYFKQIITKLYMGVKGISPEDYKDLNILYKQIKDNSNRLKNAIHDAETDNLTGVGNRKKLNADLNELIVSEAKFNVSIIDIDNFKNINDTYGHDFGDIVLKSICDAGVTLVSNSCNYEIYRFGGEEFVIIDKRGNEHLFYKIIDDWRKVTASKNWAGVNLSVTFSAGIASKQRGDKVENILKRADMNLYKAKKTGKNTIILPENNSC